MSISCSREDAAIIQDHLKTGFQPWNPENVELDIHKPFKTGNGLLKGMVLYEEDKTIEDPNVRAGCATPYIQIEYRSGSEQRSAKVIPKLNPQHNRQAGQAVFIECNEKLGKPLFDFLGPTIRDQLTPLMGD